MPDIQTLLIVDDTPSNLGLVVDLFEERGYRVAVAQDGEEGIERARRIRPDMILLDVMMPGIDGFETCRRLRADPATGDIPVIFMTALADLAERIEGFKVGGIDYIAKPLHPEEVAARVETHLKLRAARTAELSAINARLLAEADLRRHAEERLALIGFALDRVREAAYLVDANGRFHYVNEEACRQLGYTREELLTLGIGDIDADWPIKQEPQAWAAHWATLRERGSLTFETRHRAHNGEIFPVEVSASYFEYGAQPYVLGLARDIAERRRAERKLRLLKRALDNSFDATYLLGADLRFRYVNEAACRALGYSREELLSLDLTDIDPQITPESVTELMRQTEVAGSFPGTIESRHRRKDGTTFPIEVGATTFEDDGETLYLTVVRDISERHATEERMRYSERKFRTLAENAPDNIARYDRDGRMVYVNPRLEATAGRPADEMLGRTVAEIHPGVDVSDYQACIASVLVTGREAEFEATLPDTGNGLRYHHIRLVAERGETGTIVGVLAIGRDVTESRRTQATLAAREREFRTLAENIPDNIIRYDARGRKTYVNASTARLMGTPAETLLGMTPEETPEEVRAAVLDEFALRLRRVLQTGEPQEMELEVRHATEGRQIHHVRFVAERDETGDIVGALMVGHDITERVRVERELAESRDLLRELSAYRDAVREEERKRIAREIHDELGQMLTAQRLDLATLRFQFGESNPELSKRCQRMLDVADRTIQTVRGIATALRPAALDMGLIPALEWLAAEFGRRSGVDCRLDVTAPEVRLDEAQSVALFRIVQESLTNIARYAEARRVVVALVDDEAAWRLTVRDDGKGFDPTNLRVGSFGLVGIRERALMLGGAARIVSAPGAGTAVEVRIPRHSIERNPS